MYKVDIEWDEDSYRAKMVIRSNGGTEEYYSGGAPEDNSFYRDYQWVKYELERAYQLGMRAVEEAGH